MCDQCISLARHFLPGTCHRGCKKAMLTKVGNNTFCYSEDNFPKLKERHRSSFQFAASGLFSTNRCAAGHERQFAKKWEGLVAA